MRNILNIHTILEFCLPHLDYTTIQILLTIIDIIHIPFYQDIIDERLYKPFCDDINKIANNEIAKIEKIKASTSLNLFNITPPGSIINLQHLTYLSISTIPKIPICITKLKNLTKLELYNIPENKLPKELGNLSELTTLKISLCWNLRYLPVSLKNTKLTELLINSCSEINLEKTKFLKFKSLKLLRISDGYYKHFSKLLELKGILIEKGVEVYFVT